jgi:hypothetical protein
VMREWYFERWRADAEKPHVVERTSDFIKVRAQREAAQFASDIFRVRPPVGSDDQVKELVKIGVVEII